MPRLHFHKYQGTGNDFIMIDDRREPFDGTRLDLISKWCDRKFGIGADGVILVRNHSLHDFEMVYFNPDGSQSLCGNGSRCAVKFASSLGLIDKRCTFQAIDGPHSGTIENGLVSVKMLDVSQPERVGEDYFIDTGSPHHIKMVTDLAEIDVEQEGKAIRNSRRYQPLGTNVNFVEPNGDQVSVRTYERGVEAETLSCGTGVTAVALVMGAKGHQSPVTIKTMGGELQVAFEQQDGVFSSVYLIGPAEKVFQGSLEY